MSLVAHSDTKRVPEAMVMEVDPPEWTETWHPVSHRAVVRSLGKAVEQVGLQVLHKEYSLNRVGTRMFASWAVEKTGGGMHNTKVGFEIGIRNAMDKSMAIGVCAGTRVFVCDNLAFSSEYVAFRKHTGGLSIPELDFLSNRAVLSVAGNMQKEIDFLEALKRIAMGTIRFKETVFDLLSAGIVPPSQFEAFMESWEEERTIEGGPGTLAAIHGAVTRMIRGKSLIKVAKVTGMLRNFIESRM